jgi:hypothetical protein
LLAQLVGDYLLPCKPEGCPNEAGSAGSASGQDSETAGLNLPEG